MLTTLYADRLAPEGILVHEVRPGVIATDMTATVKEKFASEVQLMEQPGYAECATALFSGIVDIVVFASGRNPLLGSGWFLVDGILTVLLSLFVLFDQAFTALSLPFIFGMWLLFSGVSKFVNSFDLRRLGVRGWGWFTALGVLLAFGGFFSFLDPVAGALTLSILAGALLILQGLSSILRACFSGRFLL